jgi:hypothetical protein
MDMSGKLNATNHFAPGERTLNREGSGFASRQMRNFGERFLVPGRN